MRFVVKLRNYIINNDKFTIITLDSFPRRSETLSTAIYKRKAEVTFEIMPTLD